MLFTICHLCVSLLYCYCSEPETKTFPTLWLIYASIIDSQCLLWQKWSICLVLCRPVPVMQLFVGRRKISSRHTDSLVAVTTHAFAYYWMHPLQAHGSDRHPYYKRTAQQDEGLLKHHLNKMHLLWLTDVDSTLHQSWKMLSFFFFKQSLSSITSCV